MALYFTKAILFEKIFQEEGAFMVRVLRRLGVSDGDVDDVAQDVFIKVAENLDTYDETRPIRAWLWGFARRAASDHRRLARHRAQPLSENLDETNSDHSSFDRQTTAADTVHRALAMLPESTSELLILHELEGFTLRELAEITEAPLQTVASRVDKARRLFEEAVDKVTRIHETARTPTIAIGDSHER